MSGGVPQFDGKGSGVCQTSGAGGVGKGGVRKGAGVGQFFSRSSQLGGRSAAAEQFSNHDSHASGSSWEGGSRQSGDIVGRISFCGNGVGVAVGIGVAVGGTAVAVATVGFAVDVAGGGVHVAVAVGTTMVPPDSPVTVRA